MHKLSWQCGGEWVEFVHSRTFAREPNRIVAGVPDGDAEVFERLLTSRKPPYFLLYVLHTPRGGEGRPGRYQSPSVSPDQVRDFIDRFRGLLTHDARFDIWGYSPSEDSTVVWERHDLIYAYGPVDDIERELLALGFSVGVPTTPGPHRHSYHPEFDADARDLLAWFDWSWSELEPDDQQ